MAEPTVDVVAGLSDAQKRALSTWKFRYRSVDNPTMQALKKRGLVEWVSPYWHHVRGYWMTTEAGNRVRAALSQEARRHG